VGGGGNKKEITLTVRLSVKQAFHVLLGPLFAVVSSSLFQHEEGLSLLMNDADQRFIVFLHTQTDALFVVKMARHLSKHKKRTLFSLSFCDRSLSISPLSAHPSIFACLIRSRKLAAYACTELCGLRPP